MSAIFHPCVVSKVPARLELAYLVAVIPTELGLLDKRLELEPVPGARRGHADRRGHGEHGE